MSKLSKYKFYLSFENNYCCDYLSEKIILNAFENDIIPVIISYVDFNDTSLIPSRISYQIHWTFHQSKSQQII